jgi:adenine/guanine phosphoribosyltransferase-like PRPP-binding protein
MQSRWTDGNIEAAVGKFGEAARPLPMSLAEAEMLSIEVARRATHETTPFDVVVGLANGALLPTKVVADELGLPFEILHVRRKGSGYKQKLLFIKKLFRIPSWLILWGPFKPLWDLFQKATNTLEEGDGDNVGVFQDKRVLLIDDCIVSGASLKYVHDKLISAGAVYIKAAVICWCEDVPGGRPAQCPDIYLHRQIHTYPWAGNSDEWEAFKLWLGRHGLKLWE